MCTKDQRKRILERDGHRCVWCGVGTEYNGKLLTLQVDHIDGNRKNNSDENLRTMCPNCHSQTDTYTFNKTKSDWDNRLKSHFKEMTKEQIEKFFLEHTYEEIIDITGTSHRSLRKYVKENGIVPRHKVFINGKILYIQKEELQELLDKKSFVQIGKMYDVSEACVRGLAKKYGIHTPKKYKSFNVKRVVSKETRLKISKTHSLRWE